MSMEVIKAGLMDTFQDAGRFGYQHMGINPTGAMDLAAMRIANAIIGNAENEAVLELTFPASHFLFRSSAVITLTGADFKATLNKKPLKLNAAIFIPAGSELKFTRAAQGVFCYMAVRGGFQILPWLKSNSTGLKVKAGGLGRMLKKGDVLNFNSSLTVKGDPKISRWSVNVSDFYPKSENIKCLRGKELEWITDASQKKLVKDFFTVTSNSDRMGYGLKGPALKFKNKQQLISTAATWGTVQLLPDGSFIILMADHQTTGGYPRVAQVVAADRSVLAQSPPGKDFKFEFVDIARAEDLLVRQSRALNQIRLSCALRIREFLNAL